MTTRILLSGCCGAMGNTIAAIAAGRTDCTIVAGLDRQPGDHHPFPVYQQLSLVREDFDVVVDFSSPKALDALLDYAKATGKPLVIATTGYTQEQIMAIQEAAAQLPIFFTANMSLGVSLMKELAVTAARVLGGQFDIEIVEKHHNQKVDAPSGTALLLANAISQALPYDAKYTYDRHSSRQKRDSREIGIHSVRGGTIVGEHDIIFAGRDEVLTLTHTAYSKAIFANGALAAASFLAGKAPGLYGMAELVEQI